MSHNINGSIRNSATDWIVDNAICADPENKPKGVVEEKDRHLLDEWQDDHYTTKPEVTVVSPVRQDFLVELRTIACVVQTIPPFGELKLVLDEDHIDGATLLQTITRWVLCTPQASRELDLTHLNYVIGILSTRRDTVRRGLIPTSLAPSIAKEDRPNFPNPRNAREARKLAGINAIEGLNFEQAKAKFLLKGLGALIDEKDESSVICPSCKIDPASLIGIAHPRVS